MFESADDLFRCWINLARKNALFQLTTSALMGLLTGSLKELHLPSFFLQKPPKIGLSPAKLNFSRNVTWNGVWLKRHRVVALASNHASVHSHPRVQEQLKSRKSRLLHLLFPFKALEKALWRNTLWWRYFREKKIHQTIVKL